MPSYIKKSILSGLAFFGTGILLSIVYATIGGTWTAPSSYEATSATTLSSTSWNNILANLVNLDNRATLVQVDSGWGACWAMKTATCPAGKTVIFWLKWHSASNNNWYSNWPSTGGPACYSVNASSANIDVCAVWLSSCNSNLTNGDTNWTSRVVILCQ